MYIRQEFGKLQIKIWKHTYMIIKMGSVRNEKTKSNYNNRKNIG